MSHFVMWLFYLKNSSKVTHLWQVSCLSSGTTDLSLACSVVLPCVCGFSTLIHSWWKNSPQMVSSVSCAASWLGQPEISEILTTNQKPIHLNKVKTNINRRTSSSSPVDWFCCWFCCVLKWNVKLPVCGFSFSVWWIRGHVTQMVSHDIISQINWILCFL